jgi:DNA polymerase-3 subunit gamma/tau
VLWLTIATLGDTPTGILACAGLLLGVLIMARGARGGARERPAPAAPPPADAPAAPAPAAAAVVPAPAEDVATAEPPATTFRHGAIRFADAPEPGPEPAPEAAVAPQPPPPPEPEPEPEPAPEPEPEPAALVPPPLPQTPPTTFRQGSIRVGGLDRRRD